MKLLEKIDSVLLEKNLYHGTIRDHKKGIKRYGLTPQVGDFAGDAYYDQDLEPAVFAAQQADLQHAVNAIKSHIAKKLNKTQWKVTDQDIKKHGLLVVVSDDRDFRQYDLDDGSATGNHPPPQAEPGDYYSRSSVSPDFMLTGKKLVSFLKQRGLLGRPDFSSHPDWEKKAREDLIELMVKTHKKRGDNEDRIRKQAVKYVKGIPKRRLEKVLKKYLRKAGEERKFEPRWKLD